MELIINNHKVYKFNKIKDKPKILEQIIKNKNQGIFKGIN